MEKAHLYEALYLVNASNSDYGEGAEETRQVDQEEVRPFSEEIPGSSW